jgi:hypothetical protein
MSLKTMVNDLIKGFEIDYFTIYVKTFSTGRFQEETKLDVYIKRKEYEEKLMDIKIYFGIKPYYRPWVEFFNINNILNLGEKVEYFGTKIEEKLLNLFSNSLDNGEKIYVEYINDKETSFGLTYDFPTVVTRLGYILFNLGFTWFKDWYFPEGGNEGGQKLQGEKPLNEEFRNKHVNKIQKDVEIFLYEVKVENKYISYFINAQNRGKKLINKIG